MLQVPSSLAGLLSLLAPCFTHPSFQTFCMLMVGFVGRIRDCTVTGMLQAAGLAGEWHHSRAHNFFAFRRWEPDELGPVLVDFLVSVFVAADAPIRLAVTGTLFGRSRRLVWGARYLHDGAQPEGSGQPPPETTKVEVLPSRHHQSPTAPTRRTRTACPDVRSRSAQGR